MSWVEKNRKINNRGGGGTIIQGSRVQPYRVYQQSYVSCRKSYWTILVVFSLAKRWSYSTVGLSIQWSRPVYRNSCILQDYPYTSRDHCVVSPTLCRAMDTLVKTSVSLVLPFCRATCTNSPEQCINSLTPFLV